MITLVLGVLVLYLMRNSGAVVSVPGHQGQQRIGGGRYNVRIHLNALKSVRTTVGRTTPVSSTASATTKSRLRVTPARTIKFPVATGIPRLVEFGLQELPDYQ